MVVVEVKKFCGKQQKVNRAGLVAEVYGEVNRLRHWCGDRNLNSVKFPIFERKIIRANQQDHIKPGWFN